MAAWDAWQIPLIFRELSDDDRRVITAAYYTSVAFLDCKVSRALDALRRLNLDDNTYVVYMADHGYNLGHHGRFEKHCGYDASLRVPLIMRLLSQSISPMSSRVNTAVASPSHAPDGTTLPLPPNWRTWK